MRRDASFSVQKERSERGGEREGKRDGEKAETVRDNLCGRAREAAREEERGSE